ncbi:uncharacterized protein PAC_08593 [Phialocephala subalpina]|uniref:Uncharacterized protein n=1 Tax=Phialocephala subalpina TaxID=576137 RepID=A0A1L7X109_9HELO|nr:uncharacterized protein PAC_08593 [Phialocephala subalpina]
MAESTDGSLTAVSTVTSISTVVVPGLSYYTTVTWPPPRSSAVTTVVASTLSNGVYTTILSTVYSTLSTLPTTSSSPGTDSGNTSATSTSISSRTGSQTSSATSGTIVPTHHSGLTKGEAAGVGVGSAVAGIFLVCLGIFLFRRRSRRHQLQSKNSFSNSEAGGKIKSISPKSTLEKNNGIRATGAAVDVSPERADDSQIRNAMQALNEFINQHVENHYHLGPFPKQMEDLKQELLKLGYTDRSTPSANTMATLLISPKTRRTAIRRLIASIMIENIGLNADPETSLVPRHIIASSRTPGSQRGEKESRPMLSHHLSHFTDNDIAVSKPAPAPKPLSAFLSASQADRQLLAAAVAHNVTRLNSILQWFIRPGAESRRQQKENLSSIILEGANLGILLFSQPMEYTFGWSASRRSEIGGRSKLVVFPSITEIRERGGRSSVRAVVEAVDEDI